MKQLLHLGQFARLFARKFTSADQLIFRHPKFPIFGIADAKSIAPCTKTTPKLFWLLHLDSSSQADPPPLPPPLCLSLSYIALFLGSLVALYSSSRLLE